MLENYWYINLHIKYTQVFLSNTIQYWLFKVYLAQRLKRQDFYKFNYQ